MSEPTAAARPAARTVTVRLPSPYEGWEATLRADFPLRVLEDLASGEIPKLTAALDRIVITHNFPDSADQVAASMMDVDPSDGVVALANAFHDELGRLPPR